MNYLNNSALSVLVMSYYSPLPTSKLLAMKSFYNPPRRLPTTTQMSLCTTLAVERITVLKKAFSSYREKQSHSCRVKVINCESHWDSLGEPSQLEIQTPICIVSAKWIG